MRYFLLYIVFLCSKLHATEYEITITSSGSYKKNEMILLDDSKISLNTYDSEWTDNYGNYGTVNCLTSIKYNKKNVITYLDSYCKYYDQFDNIFTQHNTRKGHELNAGVGKAIFIEGQNKWKYLKGAPCIYSIKYLKNRIYSIRKCKITENMHNFLSK